MAFKSNLNLMIFCLQSIVDHFIHKNRTEIRLIKHYVLPAVDCDGKK